MLVLGCPSSLQWDLRKLYTFTLSPCPRVCVDLWDTLLAPVPGIWLVRCKAVTIDKAGVFLLTHAQKWKRK